MADNPLYPGYIPDPKDASPSGMYPGYFPGKATPPIPQPANYLKPLEYSFDDILSEWNELELSMTENIKPGYTGMPKWVENRILDDFKQSFNIVVKPKSVEIETLDDFDAESMPGAFGVGLGNPIDWVKDPRKTLEKTLNKWKRGALNWQDLDTRMRTELWRQMVSETPDFTVFGAIGADTMSKAAKAVSERTKGMGGRRGSPNPMSLKNSGVMGEMPKEIYIHRKQSFEVDPLTKKVIPVATEIGEEVDVFDIVALKAIDFERNVQSAGSRDDAYDDFLESAIGAIDVELSDPKFLDEIKKDTELYKTFQTFNIQSETARSMGLAREHYNALFEVKFNLEKKVLEGADLNEGFKETMDNYVEYMDRAVDNIKESYGYTDPTTGAFVAGKLEGIDSKKAAEMRKFLDPYKEHLEEMKSISKEITSRFVPDDPTDPNSTGALNLSRADANKYLNKLERITKGGATGRGHYTGDIFSTGYESALYRQIGQGMQDGGMNAVLNAMPTSFSSRILPYLGRFEYERQIYAIDEFVDALEGGNLLERYVWTRMKNFMTGRTPNYYANHFARRLYNKLGINIDQYNETGFEKGAVFKLLGGAKDPDKAPGRIFGNFFDLNSKNVKTLYNPDNIDFVKDASNVPVIVIAKGLYGGKHFKSITDLSGITAMIQSKTWDTKALHMLIMKMGTTDPTTGRILNLTNPDFLQMLADANGGKPLVFGAKQLGTLSGEIESFRDWVINNRGKFENANFDSGAYWYALIETLSFRGRNPDTKLMGIGRRYIGIVEKLYAKLNQIQTEILKRFGKYLAPISFIKTVIVEKIADLLPSLLAAGATAVSGGALAPLAPIIRALGRALRPIIRAVVRKLTDFAGKVVKGMATGDIFGAIEEIEKISVNLIKRITMILGVPFIFFLFMSHGFHKVALTTHSPVDPTRGRGADSAGRPPGIELPPGVLPLPKPPPGVGPPQEPIPPGPYGTGENCAGTHPIPDRPGNNHCYHWDGYRMQDVFVGNGNRVIAPFKGISVGYNDPIGGASVEFYPTEDISVECPSLYFTHLMPNSMLNATVAQGTTIALSDTSGSAAAVGPHVHWAASTNGNWMPWRTDLCVVQVAANWGGSCNTGDGTYGGPPLCCNSNFPDRPGCMCALNQSGCDEYYPVWSPAPPEDPPDVI